MCTTQVRPPTCDGPNICNSVQSVPVGSHEWYRAYVKERVGWLKAGRRAWLRFAGPCTAGATKLPASPLASQGPPWGSVGSTRRLSGQHRRWQTPPSSPRQPYPNTELVCIELRRWYTPPSRRSSSSWVPRSTMRPCWSTTISSAYCTVLRRWAMTSEVRFCIRR